MRVVRSSFRMSSVVTVAELIGVSRRAGYGDVRNISHGEIFYLHFCWCSGGVSIEPEFPWGP